jgi:PPOX class probable F420-dependent enzyme
MDADWLPAPDTDHGRRVRQRLDGEVVIWYTSVSRDGTPQPNPVWFLPDAGGILVYNRPDAARVQHARQGGRVALHFDGDGKGGNIVVFTGAAEVVDSVPAPDQNAAYVAKYGARMERVSGSLAEFAKNYPAAILVRPDTTRGF